MNEEKSSIASDDLTRLDPGLAFRRVTGWVRLLAGTLAVALSLFHIYTAGFGVLLEMKHRSVHLTFVLALVFLLFPARRETRRLRGPGWQLAVDLLGGVLTGLLVTAFFGGLMQMGWLGRWGVFGSGLFFSLYLHRRELWLGTGARLTDLLIGGGGLLLWLRWVLTVAGEWNAWPVSLQVWAACVALGTGLCLGKILWDSMRAGERNPTVPVIDLLLTVLAAAGALYMTVDFQGLVQRAGLPLERDLLWGALTLLLVLEATRRAAGPDLAVLALAALAFAYAGPALDGIPVLEFFAHRGFEIDRIVEHMMLGTEGVFGIPLGVVATYVFHFVLFGILVTKTGLGELFIDTALAVAGRTRGGPAKVAVLASGFFGSISGSSIANTVTTGTFTIPLMRRLGYTGRYAAAVEATASTGGQITPPIMGAAAFIMAEFTNVPYISIAACAILPAVLYYLGVGTMVHMEAVKRGIHGLAREDLPDLRESFRKNGWMLIPMLIIVALLIRGNSPFLSAFWAILLAVSLSQGKLSRRPLLLPPLLSTFLLLWPEAFTTVRVEWLLAGVAGWFLLRSKERWPRIAAGAIAALEAGMVVSLGPFLAGVWGNLLVILVSWAADGLGAAEDGQDSNRLRIREAVVALEQGARNALSIGTACACVGLVIGTASLTGFGLKFAQGTTQLAGLAATNVLHWFSIADPVAIQVFLTLVMTMIACSLLGSGLPTTATYIILITFTAPALENLGIPLLAAHMFILYYGVLSDVIPPVALSAYAAAALAREDPFRTGFTAIRLAAAGILVPFVFVYNPNLLLLPWLGLSEPGGFPLAAGIIASALGVIALGAGLTGHLRSPNRWYEGAGLVVSGILLVWPAWTPSLTGISLATAIWTTQRFRSRGLLKGES